jgi:hypothetical protein
MQSCQSRAASAATSNWRLPRFLALAFVSVLLQFAYAALAFSIESVVVQPKAPITSFDDVFLTVTILTPQSAAFLAKTNDVVIDRDEVAIVLHPDCGLLTTVGGLTESVPLGRLRVGTYRYTIVLAPVPPGAEWGTKLAQGTFTVLPRLRIEMNSLAGLFATWPSSADAFVLQYAESLSPTAVWRDLVYQREDIGDFFLVRLEKPNTTRFYRLVQR